LPTLKHREPELFDVAMFWGMAASERAQKDGISGTAFTKDQQLAKLQAARDLASRPQALEELDLCVRQAQAFSVK
jgi:hypothetical protein